VDRDSVREDAHLKADAAVSAGHEAEVDVSITAGRRVTAEEEDSRLVRIIGAGHKSVEAEGCVLVVLLMFIKRAHSNVVRVAAEVLLHAPVMKITESSVIVHAAVQAADAADMTARIKADTVVAEADIATVIRVEAAVDIVRAEGIMIVTKAAEAVDTVIAIKVVAEAIVPEVGAEAIVIATKGAAAGIAKAAADIKTVIKEAAVAAIVQVEVEAIVIATKAVADTVIVIKADLVRAAGRRLMTTASIGSRMKTNRVPESRLKAGSLFITVSSAKGPR